MTHTSRYSIVCTKTITVSNHLWLGRTMKSDKVVTGQAQEMLQIQCTMDCTVRQCPLSIDMHICTCTVSH